MSFCENPTKTNERPQHRRKTPSFSSSLLEAIYLSIDEPEEVAEEQRQEENSFPYKRNNTIEEAEEEIANLRRAIMIEKWLKNYNKYIQSSVHFNSESSKFSSSEIGSTPKYEGGFIMRTKLRALKIYSDLKKVKQPISPGGKIANFLNSLFNSRNMKKNHQDLTMSRSSCLNKPPSSRGNKSNRCVSFCPVSIIINENDESRIKLRSKIMKNSINGYRNIEEKHFNEYQFRGFHNAKGDYDAEEYEDDNRSCASSDLFELENIGMLGVHATRDDLPLYGTTILKRI
ncbi:PREDICTED: protein BIG GRAIN 1-like A [Nicotiana attenuata]|uniref:Protein big grain 1-like a n=1 Tax=Nicotiana attenuata TaxID=49451 RepID=A0A1J6KNC1_NICAT|nr:PREDICTED: protein BIG GRAIN 1-like A [Nicotiana attenuata]OIT26368.1 protein big grain 1-like a [Nicotiana attenuata]